ncbi:MAG: HAMP domain-containing sensor histidine kinase [Patescibacteria group bacterium]|jgi:signal transduction histidine kinase|nr:HAMP domain-containing sensor histidine kinase [Patescibacteria group bacterium]
MKLSNKITAIIYSSFVFFLVTIFWVDDVVVILISNLIFFYFVLLLIFFVFRKQDEKLKILKRRIEELGAGGYEEKLEVHGCDEISKLAESINKLMVDIKSKATSKASKNKEIEAAKVDFVSLASHQLRTPLSIIKWYIDYIVSGDAGEVKGDQLKYLRETYKANERMIELVNSLLIVSRIDLGTFSINPEMSDIIPVSDEIIKKFKKEIDSKGINIIKEYDEIPELNVDPSLMRLVFENLISNSVKYTPDNESIKISIKKEDKDILIKVSDKGCGIPEEQQSKIFTKLFRADNVKKIESVGTGLGLYIIKAIIEKSGGSVWFESPSREPFGKNNGDIKNAGTTIFIKIPLGGMKKKGGTKSLSV